LAATTTGSAELDAKDEGVCVPVGVGEGVDVAESVVCALGELDELAETDADALGDAEADAAAVAAPSADGVALAPPLADAAAVGAPLADAVLEGDADAVIDGDCVGEPLGARVGEARADADAHAEAVVDAVPVDEADALMELVLDGAIVLAAEPVRSPVALAVTLAVDEPEGEPAALVVGDALTVVELAEPAAEPLVLALAPSEGVARPDALEKSEPVGECVTDAVTLAVRAAGVGVARATDGDCEPLVLAQALSEGETVDVVDALGEPDSAGVTEGLPEGSATVGEDESEGEDDADCELLPDDELRGVAVPAAVAAADAAARPLADAHVVGDTEVDEERETEVVALGDGVCERVVVVDPQTDALRDDVMVVECDTDGEAVEESEVE